MQALNLDWVTEGELAINGITFFVTFDANVWKKDTSSEDSFILAKDRSLIDKSVAMSQKEKVSNILEIGIFKGGSIVFYDQIFQPDRIVGIEYKKKPIDALQRYIDKQDKSDSIMASIRRIGRSWKAFWPRNIIIKISI